MRTSSTFIDFLVTDNGILKLRFLCQKHSEIKNDATVSKQKTSAPVRYFRLHHGRLRRVADLGGTGGRQDRAFDEFRSLYRLQ